MRTGRRSSSRSSHRSHWDKKGNAVAGVEEILQQKDELRKDLEITFEDDPLPIKDGPDKEPPEQPVQAEAEPVAEADAIKDAGDAPAEEVDASADEEDDEDDSRAIYASEIGQLPDDLKASVEALPEDQQQLFLGLHNQRLKAEQGAIKAKRRMRSFRDERDELTKDRSAFTKAVLERLGPKEAATASDAPASAAEGPKADGIPLSFNEETGQYEIPPEAIKNLIGGAQQQFQAQSQQAQQVQSQKVQMLSELIGQTPNEVQTKLAQAWQLIANKTQEYINEAGLMPSNFQETLAVFEQGGARDLLGEKFPDVALEDILELDRGFNDPANHGLAVTRVTQKYTEQWTDEAQPAAAARPNGGAKVAIDPQKPRTMGRRGKSIAEKSKTPVEEFSSMSASDIMNMGPDDLEKWREKIDADLRA